MNFIADSNNVGYRISLDDKRSIAKSIITQYDGWLPFSVAVGISHMYLREITCSKHVSYKFLYEPFIKWNKQTFYHYKFIEDNLGNFYLVLDKIRICNLLQDDYSFETYDEILELGSQYFSGFEWSSPKTSDYWSRDGNDTLWNNAMNQYKNEPDDCQDLIISI